MKKFRKIIELVIIFFIIITVKSTVSAANAAINGPDSVFVGDTITIKITGNAASWSGLTLKASGPISGSGGVMANVTDSGENENVTMGTYTFTATDVGTAKFSLTGKVVNSDYTSQDYTEAKPITKNVTIKPKEQPKPVEEQKPAEQSTQETQKPVEPQKPVQNNTSNTKKTTNKNTNTNKKTEAKVEKKVEQPVVVVNEEDQGTKEELLIDNINVFAINIDETKTEIGLEPVFDSNILEYTLNVENNVKTIDLDIKYTESYTIKIEGLEEDLKVGENIVKVTVSRGEESKTYLIKVTKAEPEKVEETQIEAEAIEEKSEIKEEKNKITMTISQFIWTIVFSIIAAVLVSMGIYIIIKNKKKEKVKNEVKDENME